MSATASSLVTESGGEPAGEITAVVTVLDTSSNPGVMPGDFVSRSAATGELEPIESFGAINLLFEDENGESLNLRSGQEATVSIPLAEGIAPEDAPATATLFYWSDEMGHWIEQGSASLEQVEPGTWAYTGAVSHFSTWNVGGFWVTIQIRGCVEDREANPVSFARVMATGMDYIGETSITADANGYFSVTARRSSEIELSVLENRLDDPLTLSTGSEPIALEECLLADYSVTIDPDAPVAQTPPTYGVGSNWTFDGATDTTVNSQTTTTRGKSTDTFVEILQFNGRETALVERSSPLYLPQDPCDGTDSFLNDLVLRHSIIFVYEVIRLSRHMTHRSRRITWLSSTC